jgi:conjugative relaxase-like TrwC/TraI family protein
LVVTHRPGFELVVSAHKSVAVLGVIDRADEMHSTLDVETSATMDWLDGWIQDRGGRRGRAQHRTATGGLVYARTRHATSRAGDPSPHDHVLVANIVEMLDVAGGRKGLDSAALRHTAEAATMVGRLHAAARAVELGYRIERDDGPSGNLRPGASTASRRRCVTSSPSAPTTSPSTSPPPASTATTPAP